MRVSLRNKFRRWLRQEQGTQLVEMAVCLPVILILLGATAEFGRFFYTYTTLTAAVRAGARHACKWRIGDNWTIPETQNFVVYGDVTGTALDKNDKPLGPVLPDLTTSHVKLTANGASATNIQTVTVKIENYKYQPIFDLGKMTGMPSLSLNINMNATATMKQLFNGPVSY